MSDLTQVLLGSGATGAPILMLVLTGRLIPIWVVNKQIAALEKSHAAALKALGESHQRELISQAQAHADALAVRDRGEERLAGALQIEREAKDVERNRSDALAERLSGLAQETSANGLKLVAAIREAASGESR